MFLRTYVCLKTSRVQRYEYVEEVVIVLQAAGPACAKVLRQREFGMLQKWKTALKRREADGR